MNRLLVAVCGLILVLTGCGTGGSQRGFKSFLVEATSTGYVSVDVIDEQYIVVNVEPVYIKQDTDNAIYWYLKPGGAYYFPDTRQDRGIDFQAPHPTDLSCHLDNGDKYTFICTYKKAPKKKYLYLIKVTKDGTNFLTSDPTVMNN
jgi:hypothetical protein